MKTVILTYSKLEDPRFYLECEIMEKFFSDHNLTKEECESKPLLEVLGSPFNMGTYLQSSLGPAYVLKAKDAYTKEDGTKVDKDGILHAEYWFEGKRRFGQDEEQLKQSIAFGNKFESLINEDN